MLARYRCNELKETALLEAEGRIQSLASESSIKLMDDFKAKCDDILQFVLGKLNLF
jgi:hypothetical protein